MLNDNNIFWHTFVLAWRDDTGQYTCKCNLHSHELYRCTKTVKLGTQSREVVIRKLKYWAACGTVPNMLFKCKRYTRQIKHVGSCTSVQIC